MKKHSLLFLILLSIVMTTQAQSPEQKLQQLGITLPVPAKPVATYVNAVRTGNLIYLSGKGPTNADGTDITGKLGKDLSIEQGYAAAKSTGINLLAALKAEIGSLDKVKRIVKVLGMVNCVPGFEHHPFIINGCSELFAEVWGTDNGIGVRSAVGMGSLPNNISVEIEVIFELHEV